MATVPKFKTLLGADDDDKDGGIAATGSEFTPGKKGSVLLKAEQLGNKFGTKSGLKFENTRPSFAGMAYQAAVGPTQGEWGNEGGSDGFWYDPNAPRAQAPVYDPERGATGEMRDAGPTAAAGISKSLNVDNFNVLGAENSGADMLKYLDRSYGTGWSDGLDAHMEATRAAYDAQYGGGKWGSGEGGSYHQTEAMKAYLDANGMTDDVSQEWYAGRTQTDTMVRERQIADRNAGSFNFGSFMSSFGSVLLPALAAWAAPLVMGGSAAAGAAGEAAMTAGQAANLGAAEALFQAPISQLGTQAGLDAVMSAGAAGAGAGASNGQWDVPGSPQQTLFDQIKAATDSLGNLRQGLGGARQAEPEGEPQVGGMEFGGTPGNGPRVVELQPGQEPGKEVRGGAGGGAQAPSTVSTFLTPKNVDPNELKRKLGYQTLLGR